MPNVEIAINRLKSNLVWGECRAGMSELFNWVRKHFVLLFTGCTVVTLQVIKMLSSSRVPLPAGSCDLVNPGRRGQS